MHTTLKYITLALLGILSILNGYSQQTTRSSYSIYGVGLLNYDGFSDNAANGRNGLSYRHESNYSFTNPASISALQYSVFNTAAYMNLGKLKTTNIKQDFSNAGFNYIALAVPLKKYKSGLAFGLLPFSDVGYNVINKKDSGGVVIRNEFEGIGGLSKVNIGLATDFFKHISLGVNYSNIFGQISESAKRRYPGNRYMTSYADQSSVSLRGNHLDLGLQLHTASDSGLSHVLGFVFSSRTKLNGSQDRFVYTFTEIYVDNEIPKDTLINTKEKNVAVELPKSFSVSYSIGNHEKWQATLGYSKSLWSQYSSIYGGNDGLMDDQAYSAGLFVCPVPHFDNSIKSNKASRYLKSIRYSVGFYHNDGYISAYDSKIAQNGLSIGLGLPFTRVQKSLEGNFKMTSRIFLTGEFIRRGTLENTLIQEDFFKITLGLNLADKWFKKRLFN